MADTDSPSDHEPTSDDDARVEGAHRRGRRVLILLGAVAIVAVVVGIIVSLSMRTTTEPSAVASSFATVAPRPSVRVTVPPSARPTAPAVAPLPSGSAQPGASASPIPLTSTATPVSAVKVAVGSIRAVAGKADGQGEVDAPAIRFEITVANGRTTALSLASAVVTVAYGTDGTPADEYVSARRDLPASVGAGRTVTGTYEFAVPKSSRGSVSIAFDYQVGTPVTVFTGRTP